MFHRQMTKPIADIHELTRARESIMGGSNAMCWDNVRGCLGGEEQDRVSYSTSGHVVKYDVGSIHRLGFAVVLRGTVLEDPFLILQTLTLICISIGIALVYGIDDAEVVHAQAEHLATILDPLHALSAFLLALFVSLVMSRWLDLRYNGVGGVLGHTADLCVHVGQSMGGKDLVMLAVRRRVLRYVLLCLMLLFLEMRGETSLAAFGDAGLLDEDERLYLRAMPQGKWAATVAMWLGRTVVDASLARNPEAAVERKLFLEQLFSLRGAIGKCGAMVDSQIPLPYIALITLLVKLTLLAYSLFAGFRLRLALDAEDWLNFVSYIFLVALYSIFYQGCLNLHTILSNPFGYDAADCACNLAREAEARAPSHPCRAPS